MGATLHVLGAGSILPRAGYGCSGYALEPDGTDESGAQRGITLLDCGPGSIRALGAAGLGVERVERVVFSHYHLDHCLDVFALFFARHNPHLRERLPRLAIHGPPGLEVLLENAPAALGHWARDVDAVVAEVPLDARGQGGFDEGGARFSCVRTLHMADSVAWRIDLPDGSSLAYTGDTGPNPDVSRLAQDVDLFAVECSFADDAATTNHLSPTSAGRMAAQAGARRLLLTHFYPGLNPEEAAVAAGRVYDGPIELARDGSVHRVP